MKRAIVSHAGRFGRLAGTLLVSAVLGIVLWLVGEHRPLTGQDAAPATPAGGDVPVELAPYMGELQRLTHKLSLSIAHSNGELAKFYLYESLEALREIQEEVPEYRGLPIAFLVDRLARPRYEELKSALQEAADGDANPGAPDLAAAMAGVVESCNQCHVATQHGFIKITNETRTNPFNQDFAP